MFQLLESEPDFAAARAPIIGLASGSAESGPVALIPDEVAVRRSDPVYMAHAYLTKVPVTAITPFIEAFTIPGDVVLDMYGGSGMTGVAAALVGRRAEIRDISVLGHHIGRNYVNLVPATELAAAGRAVITASELILGDAYGTRCEACSGRGTLSRTVWSYVYECRACAARVNYYDSFAASGWRKAQMTCASCGAHFVTRGSKRLSEEPVVDTVTCGCSRGLRDQPHSPPLTAVSLDGVRFPDLPIGSDRQMFHASALGRHGLTSTAKFFSGRNLAVLATLHREILAVEDDAIRDKLLFAFTAILSRASKRYQWHPKRPLNAANANYYIAPVFYEWNVYDLFLRKIDAVAKSDDFLRNERRSRGLDGQPEVNYRVGSADALDLPDATVDYVFTDPPFGSNIFYSDMNLFHEAWLGRETDHAQEAVVDRSGSGPKRRTAERYEGLITRSLQEAHRVLKDDGRLSLVFSNSSGAMWALVQRAIHEANFSLEHVAVLNKGQRSVKGLASGFENVVTVDLILTMRKAAADDQLPISTPPDDALEDAISNVLAEDSAPTPSHVYLHVIRQYLDLGWDVSALDIANIGLHLLRLGFDIDSRTGRLEQTAAAQS